MSEELPTKRIIMVKGLGTWPNQDILDIYTRVCKENRGVRERIMGYSTVMSVKTFQDYLLSNNQSIDYPYRQRLDELQQRGTDHILIGNNNAAFAAAKNNQPLSVLVANTDEELEKAIRLTEQNRLWRLHLKGNTLEELCRDLSNAFKERKRELRSVYEFVNQGYINSHLSSG